jgi:hypothetical protein
MRIWSRIIIAALVLSAFAAASAAATPDTYEVSATLSHAGQSFAAPSAVVKADQRASIEVSGAEGYKLTLTVTDLAPDEIQVNASVDSPYGAMKPTLIVRPDQPASVSVGDLGLELTVRRVGG